MTGPKAMLVGVRHRLGDHGMALLTLGTLLLLLAAPLVALPAVRCEVFGGGCRTAERLPPQPQPKDRSRPLTPLEAATQGRYVALGDSYSSGEGAYTAAADRSPLNRCHRTSASYYHAVAKSFSFAKGSAFWACAGAKTGSMLRGQAGEPPQVTRVNADTSLVTVSIGGNDAGFTRVLAGCLNPFSSCSDQGSQVASRLAGLRRTLPAVLEQITDRAPRARVLVLGYPRLFSEASGSFGDGFSVGEQQWLNGRGRELNGLIKEVAAEADRRVVATHGQGSVEFVDGYSAFAGHEVGSGDPYVNGLDVNLAAMTAEAQSFHPTSGGYQALASLFVQQVKTGPGRPLNQYR